MNLLELKTTWLSALKEAEDFIGERPPDELGCLYFSKAENKFIQPGGKISRDGLQLHRGAPGGVLPVFLN